MATEKLQSIEAINDLNEFESLIFNVLERHGIIDLKEKSPFITGALNSPLGNQTLLFYFEIERLGKNFSNFERFAATLEKQLKSNSYNSVFIVSPKYITEGFKERLGKHFANVRFDFWDREVVISKIDEKYPDYWRHNDQNLLSYEKEFVESANDDWSLKKIRQFKAAHEKLLKIFIEPRLHHKVSDFESQKKAFVRVPIEKIREFKNPVVLEGELGAGKTRLLKKIGIDFTQANTNKSGKKFLPIFINNISLIETRKSIDDLISIDIALEKTREEYFSDVNIDALANNYTLVFLIDSLDEFNKDNQEALFNDLKKYSSDHRIFIGTRFQDYNSMNGVRALGKCEEVYIEKFNDSQIKSFVSSYFKNDKGKADNLLESLKENSIIQRLPITPLNLSLISILYEENNFEIPATITDIYDNFNNLLIGRSLPDSRFDFFDINIRERILSAYALELLNRGERNYMTKEEFNEFFKAFFDPVKHTIDIRLLPEALDFLINNTGILILQDGVYVKFLHESYMEYYASKEIFNYHRETLEQKLIDNFLEINWQYTAIFYAGRTKKMNDFLVKLIERTKKSRKVIEFFKSIHGLGYVSQALYLTDDNIRKNAVLASLSYMVEIYEWMKKLGADEKIFFKSLSLPISAIINSMYFFEGFNSITIKGPLNLAFEELFPLLEGKDDLGKPKFDSTTAFKLFTIAFTLTSPRLGDLGKIKKLIYETPILNDPLFEKLLDFGVSIAGNKELYEFKEKLKSPSKAKRDSDIVKFGKDVTEVYLTTPIGRLRFSQYDRISTDRKVLLLTEGKTDAQIIEHAFIVLTDLTPYWEIQPIHDTNGGASELAKALENGAKLTTDKTVIGIFDNDDGGIQHFNGTLRETKFSFYGDCIRIKKHKEADIYGLKLPISPLKNHYYHKEQKFNFFSIEHYFSDDLLRSQNMLLDTPMSSSNIYKIRDTQSAKNDFSKFVRNNTSPQVFKDFVFLFREIDMICGVSDIEYEID